MWLVKVSSGLSNHHLQPSVLSRHFSSDFQVSVATSAENQSSRRGGMTKQPPQDVSE